MKPEIHRFLRSVLAMSECNLCIMLSKDPEMKPEIHRLLGSVLAISDCNL